MNNRGCYYGCQRVVGGGFIAAAIADHMVETVAEIKILIETGMIPMQNANLLKNDLYPNPYRVQQLVSNKLQW